MRLVDPVIAVYHWQNRCQLRFYVGHFCCVKETDRSTHDRIHTETVIVCATAASQTDVPIVGTIQGNN